MSNSNSQRYVSRELTHFVGRSLPSDEARYQLFKSILMSGWLTHPPHKMGESHKSVVGVFDPNKLLSEDGLSVRGIVCFCDIPPGDFQIHMGKYSRFGFSFSKQFLIKKGANPVFYIATDSYVYSEPPFLGIQPRISELLAAFEADNMTRGLFFDNSASVLIEFITLALRIVGDTEKHRVDDRFGSEALANGRQKIKFLFNINDDDCDELFRILSKNEHLSRIVVHFIDFFVLNCVGFMKPFIGTLSEDDEKNYYMEREWRVVGNIPFAISDIERVILPREFVGRFYSDFPQYRAQIHYAELV